MRNRITEELRTFIGAYVDEGLRVSAHGIADRIDAEHERRMERSRYEARRAVLNYLGGVLVDYKKGVKRVRKCDKEEVVRCRDCFWSYVDKGTYVCNFNPAAAHYVGPDAFCSYGKRIEEDDDE